jgi:hypothetical protein
MFIPPLPGEPPGDPELGGFRPRTLRYGNPDQGYANPSRDAAQTREARRDRSHNGSDQPPGIPPYAGEPLPLRSDDGEILGTFSCNCYREVWRPTGRGYTSPNSRVYLNGKNALLDWVVKVVLKHYPDGGRFRIKAISNSEYGVIMARNGDRDLVCKFPRR